MRTPAALVPILFTCAVQAALPEAVDGEPLPSLAPMLEQTTAGVVNVATLAPVRAHRSPLERDPFFRRFFNLPERAPEEHRAQSAGSGVVVDAKTGYIVTNHHVVKGASEIHVALSDGRDFPAKLVGVDTQVDLAVLKIEADALQEMTFGNSRRLRVGDFVVAIGNPFGLEQTVTSGIVSALGRSGLGIEGYENFIQTDASINPGNSGGALVDLNGRLVGINTAIVAPSGGNVGIGFAIPSNLVAAIIGEIIEHGVVRRGRIGIAVAALSAQGALAQGVDATEGVVVNEVAPGGAAESAGVRAGDILVSINGRRIGRAGDFGHQEAITMVGDELDVEVIRDGRRQRIAVDIKLNWSVAGVRVHRQLAGAVLMDLYQDEDPGVGAGVRVNSIDNGSAAWQTGLRAGDILLAVDSRTTYHIGELARFLGDADQKPVRVRVQRNGRLGSVLFNAPR